MVDRPSNDPPVLGSVPLVDRICTACIETIPVAGAAVSVTTTGGDRITVCASDPVAARLEELQFLLGEGPGVDAFRLRAPVLIADLDAPGAVGLMGWTAFGPAAVAAGARAVYAFPLVLGAATLGVLQLYAVHARRLDAAQRARALRLADAAFFAVLDLLSGSPERGSDDVDEVLPSYDGTLYRAEVYQAAGMVMAQLDVSIEDATVRLRAFAYAHGRSVVDVARDIVQNRLRLHDDHDPNRSGSEEPS